MTRWRILVVLVLVPFFVSCGGGGGGSSGGGKQNTGEGFVPNVPGYNYDPAADDPEPSFEWREFLSYPGSYSNIPRQLVIRTESEYSFFWSLCMVEPQMGPGMGPQTRPEVDLDKYMIVAVFIGAYPGHSDVDITNVSQQGDGILVEYRHNIPGPGWPPDGPNAFGQPYTSALVTRTDGPVQFKGTVNAVPFQ
jgi:hypothetical protein